MLLKAFNDAVQDSFLRELSREDIENYQERGEEVEVIRLLIDYYSEDELDLEVTLITINSTFKFHAVEDDLNTRYFVVNDGDTTLSALISWSIEKGLLREVTAEEAMATPLGTKVTRLSEGHGWDWAYEYYVEDHLIFKAYENEDINLDHRFFMPHQ